MPLDPRIPLAVQPPSTANPLDIYAQIMRIQEARESAASLRQERETTDQINQERLGALRQSRDIDTQATQLYGLLDDPDTAGQVLQQIRDPRVAVKLQEY